MGISRVLITGGTGFVGKHLQQGLKDRGIDYAVFSSREYDLTVREEAEAAFAAHKGIGTILHLASFQAAADFPAKHPAEQFFRNNLIHLHVLEGWRKYFPQAKLIAIGTSCAYPSEATRLTEEAFLDGAIHGSVYSYAFTKRLLYTGILAYNDQYGMNGSYLIPATMYGEYDDFHVETAHVSGALIGKFVRAVREGVPEVEIWGDGTQVREFMYVRDFIDALIHLIPLCDRDIVNVGPGKGTSIKDLAEMIRGKAGFKGKLVLNKERYVGIKEKVMDVGKLARKYGHTVNSDLAPGVGRTVQWYSDNYDHLRDKRKFAEEEKTMSRLRSRRAGGEPCAST